MGNTIKFDKVNFFCVLVLCGFSLMSLYSISYGIDTETNYFLKQLLWVSVGIGFYILVSFLPIKITYSSIYWLYALIVLSLIVVMFFGNEVNGSKRWFLIGPLKFQPSEPAKIITILALARFLTSSSTDLKKFRDICISLLIIFIPFELIRSQPDLGTSLTFIVIAVPMMFWGGLPGFYVFAVVSTLLIAISSFIPILFFGLLIVCLIILYFFKTSQWLKAILLIVYIVAGFSAPKVWNDVLKPHQRSRVMTFINPKDVKGSGYQVTQSRIAIGSGGEFGKGMSQGTQVQLKLVPEVHTDMIICIVGEEFGFFGIIIIVFTFGYLMIRLVYIAAICRNRFSGIILVGVGSLLFYHVFTNMGMAIGIMPVTGLPLPFMSYGGSAMMTNMIMLGYCGNLIAKRHEV